MLEVSRLVKKFGAVVAVDDVSLAVSAGEVLGLLGPNRAGKSTTLKMIAGVLAPTSGTVTTGGYDIGARPLKAKRQIGYLAEGAPAYAAMTAAGFLAFIARLRGLSGRAARRDVARAAALTGIGAILHLPIGALSQDDRRRVGLAQALLRDPPVVILDEPTGGLDPNQQDAMHAVIRAISPHKAIVIATRRPRQVEAVCGRAIIIAGGQVVAGGTLAELRARSRHHNAVRLALATGADAAIAAELACLPGVLSVEPAREDEGGGWWIFPWRARPIVGEVTRLVHARGWPVSTLRAEQGRLDDVFRAATVPEAAAAEPSDIAA